MSEGGFVQKYIKPIDAPLLGAAIVGVLFVLSVSLADEYSRERKCTYQAGGYEAQAENSTGVPDHHIQTASPASDRLQQSEENRETYSESCQADKGFGYFLISVLRRFARFLRHYSELVTAVFTVVLAAATFRLWKSTNDLWIAGEKQAGLLRESIDKAEAASTQQSVDMQASIAAADVAAKAAQKSAKVAEDTLMLFERPWIFASLSPQIYFNEEHMLWGASFNISNHGRSPAIIDVALIGIGAIVNDSPPTGVVQDQLHGPLGSGEKISKIWLLTPADIKIDPFEGNTGEPNLPSNEDLGVTISIHYRDIAGNPHNSAFAWRYDMKVHRWVKFDGDRYNYQN